MRSFSALVPEVFYFGAQEHQELTDFLKLRLDVDLRENRGELVSAWRAKIELREAALRRQAESSLRRRVEAVRRYVEKGAGGSLISLERIFQEPGQEDLGRRELIR